MTQTMLNAKEQAILDIREELQRLNKRFIVFKESLDDAMESLVKKEEEKRKPRTSWCINAYTLKKKP